MKHTKVEDGPYIRIKVSEDFVVEGELISIMSKEDFTEQWHTVRVDYPNTPEREFDIFTGKLI